MPQSFNYGRTVQAGKNLFAALEALEEACQAAQQPSLAQPLGEVEMNALLLITELLNCRDEKMLAEEKLRQLMEGQTRQ